MRVLFSVLLLVLVLGIVLGQRNDQRRPNNRRPNNNFRGQLPRGGRQNRGFRNNNNNNRNNRNNNRGNNRRPKQSGGCGGGNAPNHKYKGQDYLVSWQICDNKFTQDDAVNFCRANNMVPISIDSRDKENHFLGLLAQDRQRYFWTGGKVNGRIPRGKIEWPSGNSYNRVNWSNTGGAERPQPDNREGNEFCLAVLNNFYADGIRFHDVSCHHKKPTICEARGKPRRG